MKIRGSVNHFNILFYSILFCFVLRNFENYYYYHFIIILFIFAPGSVGDDSPRVKPMVRFVAVAFAFAFDFVVVAFDRDC
jgi:hypothetical protein